MQAARAIEVIAPIDAALNNQTVVPRLQGGLQQPLLPDIHVILHSHFYSVPALVYLASRIQ